jgi:hypothetical protein
VALVLLGWGMIIIGRRARRRRKARTGSPAAPG